MARSFAYKVEQQDGDLQTKIKSAYQQALNRQADERVVTILQRLYDKALMEYKNDSVATCEIIGVMDEHNKAETAAMVVLTNAIFNLDEFVTRN